MVEGRGRGQGDERKGNRGTHNKIAIVKRIYFCTRYCFHNCVIILFYAPTLSVLFSVCDLKYQVIFNTVRYQCFRFKRVYNSDIQGGSNSGPKIRSASYAESKSCTTCLC